MSSSVDIKQGSKEWFEVRKNKITASVFGEAVGVSKYVSPRSLWQKLTGKITVANNNLSLAVAHGTKYEDVARKVYEKIMGKKVLETGFYIHSTFSWLGASPDGLIGNNGVLEIKCPLRQVHHDIPPHYLAQIQGQLECANKDYCDFFSYHTTTTEYKIYRVYRSQVYWKWLFTYLKDFYCCVQMDIDPLTSNKISIPPRIQPPACEIELLLHNTVNGSIKLSKSVNASAAIQRNNNSYRPQHKCSLSKKQYRSLISRSNMVKLNEMRKIKNREGIS
eukprot:g5056.t1